jgi:long-chain acyl-CoA synthetase
MAKEYPDKAQYAEKMLDHMQEIVNKVNKDLLPYKRITRVTIADEPLEMTSTKKIKRHVVAEVYQDR